MNRLEGYQSSGDHSLPASDIPADTLVADRKREPIIHANHGDLYETIYLEETTAVHGSAMIFRCSMVVAAALVAFSGLQFYKGFSQDQLHAKTSFSEPESSANTTSKPAIDPTTTASIGNNNKVVEREPEPVQTLTKSYVIQPGDTLSAIGKKHGVSAQSIMAANGIENPRLIKPGMKLKIVKN